MTLYIIGNGFDLKHDLPSRYSNFADYCKLYYPCLFEQVESAFPEISKDSLWSNFEEGLGEPSEKVLKDWYDLNQTDNENKRDNDSFELFFRDLKEALKEWIRYLNSCVSALCRHYCFEDDSLFLSFNYTRTLEDVYGIDSALVKHIHECAERENEEICAGYIFGHGKNIESSHSYIDSFDYQYKDLLKHLSKDYKTKDLEEFLKEGKDISKIIVLGHSLNKIDDTYFDIINKTFPEAKWYVDYTKCMSLIKKMRSVMRIGIKNVKYFKSK